MNGEQRLERWPIHLEMVPVKDEVYDDADLLLASDCATYGYGFNTEVFKSGRVPVIGCHKVDEEKYKTKFVEILKENNIRKITILRIDLFCCEGTERDIREAVFLSGKDIPIETYIVDMESRVTNA